MSDDHSMIGPGKHATSALNALYSNNTTDAQAQVLAILALASAVNRLAQAQEAIALSASPVQQSSHGSEARHSVVVCSWCRRRSYLPLPDFLALWTASHEGQRGEVNHGERPCPTGITSPHTPAVRAARWARRSALACSARSARLCSSRPRQAPAPHRQPGARRLTSRAGGAADCETARRDGCRLKNMASSGDSSIIPAHPFRTDRPGSP